MSAAKVQPIASPRLAEVARQCMGDVGNNLDAAAETLLDLAAAPTRAGRDLAAEMMREAARSACRMNRTFERRALWAPPKARVSPKERLEMAIEVEDRLLDWQLSGGLRLRDAVRGDVEAEAGMYSVQADTLATRAGWMWRIAAALPDGETPVGVALSTEQLRALQSEE